MPAPWWEQFPQKHIYHWSVLHSTHQEALSWAETYPMQDALWVWLRAHRQTKGVGQFSRSFLSPLGGMYATLMCCWPTDAAFPLISLVVGLALIDALPLSCQLKWVNDIYKGDQKLAGVLITRLVVNHKVVYLISFGLNVNSMIDLTPEGRAVTSIKQHLGQSLDLERLWEKIETSLYHRLMMTLSADQTELIQDLNRILMYKNQEVYVRTAHKWLYGVFGGIAPSGHFLLEGQEIHSVLSIGTSPSVMV